jgi:hypothetical protein
MINPDSKSYVTLRQQMQLMMVHFPKAYIAKSVVRPEVLVAD